jgi:glycerol-3-phosphate acyltransferase PlsX
VAIDVMGAEHGSKVFIKAVAQVVDGNRDFIPILVGDKEMITPLLAKYSALKDVRLVHAPDVIAGDEKASTAYRLGKDSSMRKAIDLIGSGEADAVVSGGNTGALMAMSLMVLRTIDGIDRPALAAYMPTAHGQCCVLDLGANIECSSDHLVQFALMGDAFCRVTSDVKSPSIGLLNVGEEQQKGNTTIREAAAVLINPENGLNYKGFIEGNDITAGTVDVVVTDGFTGNIVLKSIEGASRLITKMMRRSFESGLMAKIGYIMVSPALKVLRDKLDPQRYNGAVLMGLNGIVIKSHGSATEKGIHNAIGMAISMINNQFLGGLRESVGRSLKSIDTAENNPESEK